MKLPDKALHLVGCSADNLIELLKFNFILNSPTSFPNAKCFNLVMLLNTVDKKEWGVFNNTRKVFETFELLINILGFIFEEKSMFKNIFQNILEPFIGLDTPILYLHHVIIYKLLSRKLVEFSKILRMNVVAKMSSSQVVEFCQKNLTIDFPKLMIQAQVFVPPNVVNKKPKIFNTKFNGQNVKQITSPVVTPNVASLKSSVCTVNLASQLQVLPKDCKHGNKCKFTHVSIMKPCLQATKDSWISHIEKVANSDDFKSKMVAAINALP